MKLIYTTLLALTIYSGYTQTPAGQGDFDKSQQMMAKMEAGKLAAENLKGTVAPEFAYEDIDRKIVTSKSLKGKYVYIDIWATWCGPCREQFPYLKKIEKKFHGKNIAFVSISIDKLRDINKWKQTVADQSLGGIQLIADNDWQSDFIKKFDVGFIPRFILIGPDGKIIDADAKRPSEPELKEQLEALLK